MTIVDCFKKVADSKKVIHEIATGKELTLKEVWGHAAKRMSLFQDKDQEVITVILPNSIAYIEHLLAVIGTNNIFNPIPYFVSIQELEKVLEYVEPACLVTDRKDIIERFQKTFTIIDPDAQLPAKGTMTNKKIDENLPAALYYSSGTTGDPKGVLYSHKNMVSLIASINREFHFTADDNQLAFLPFGHTASINYNILPALMAGSNLFISKGFEELRSDFFEKMARYRISYTEIVPTILLMLLKLDIDVSKLDLSCLRFIGCGSSTLPLTSQKAFMEKYNIPVGNLYGLSETGPSHIDDPTEEGWKPGSVGRPLDVNQCKVAHDGEILLKGDNIFAGYYKNPKLYAQVVKDGWFHTGDIGFERDGKYYFVDRKKDLIIKGGINIVPMEIEEVFYKDNRVHECVVVGKEDKLVGEDIVAVVVPKDKSNAGNDFVRELKQFSKNRLSNYKVPSRILIWDQLPKTHSNKLMRRKVREIVNGSLELDFLVDAIREAGKAALKAFDSKKYCFLTDFRHEKITEKSSHELVVEEDILCQDILIEGIKEFEPEAIVYSEELNNLGDLKADRSERKYLIDPLDGTHNFCFGLPFWGISVAVLDKNNVPVAGVIYLPFLNVLLKCDGPGHPSMMETNGVWAEVTTAQKDMNEALICYDNQFYKMNEKAFKIYQNLSKECFTTRILGSATADIALIATGKINARIWNKTNSYDIAGGISIVKGAGGSVSDFNGDEADIFAQEVVMCSDELLNDKIVETIRRS